MAIVGLILAFAGFLLSVASLGIASSVGARMIIIVGGIGVSLAGILYFVNGAYLKNAIWRK